MGSPAIDLSAGLQPKGGVDLSSGLVPVVPQFSNPKGEGTYKMSSPAGKADVPYSQVETARASGLQIDPTDAPRYAKDYFAAQPGIIDRLQSNIANPQELQPTGGFIHDNIIAPAVHIANRMAQNLTAPAVNGLQDAFSPDSPGAKTRAIAADQYNQAQQQRYFGGGSTTPIRDALEMTTNAMPLVSGIGSQVRSNIESAHPVTNTLGDIGTAALLAGLVKSFPQTPPNVNGQNYNPNNAAAFEGLLAKANGMGPNFRPQNPTSDALSPLRQSAADMLANGTPQEQSIVRTAMGATGKPLDRLTALPAIIQRSLSDVEANHAPVLAQVSNTPVDMTSIQQGLKAQIKPGMSAADIAGINDLIDRSGQITNLGELNGFRGIMNEEASPSYRQSPTQAGRASAPQQVATDTANAVRAHYFDQMQNATVSPQNPNGIDFQPLKSQESQLLTTKEAIERILSPESKAEATFNAGGKSTKEVLGDLANVIKEPRTTVTQTLLRESPATRSANLIRLALKDLPEANPVPAITQNAVGAQPPIAGNLPANASPPTIQGTPVGAPPPSPSPIGLQAPAQLQLPAGGDPRFLAPAASPGTPAPPSTPYPSLNEATARTRIAPTQFASPEVIPPSGARPVTPSGQVMTPIQRFLQAGDLEPTTTNPSVDDLKRAIAGMRKKSGK
jgi:hypothetical protein